MTRGDENLPDDDQRFAEASAWFARMRGPEAADARAEFETWRQHPANDAAYREMEAIWKASAAVPPAAVRRPVRLRPGLIAASLAAALAIGFLAWNTARTTETSAAALYSTEQGTIRTVALADGTRITLDTDSRISAELGPDERRVTLLSGRARFAVAKDPRRTFVVLANDDAVVARGTVFDVRMTDRGTEVTLYEGAVDLERRSDHAAPRSLGRLNPGQKALFRADNAPPAIAGARADRWPDGVLSGDNMRLEDVLAEANRYGRNKIVLEAPSLGSLQISGGFRPAETQKLAETLAAALDLTLSRAADGDFVLSRRLSSPVSIQTPLPNSVAAGARRFASG